MFCTIRYRCMDEVEGREIQAAGLPLLLTRESSHRCELRVPRDKAGRELIGEIAERPTAAHPRPTTGVWDAGGMRQDSKRDKRRQNNGED
jgi:hypothetical protein